MRMFKIFDPKPGAAPWEARIALLGVLFVIMFALANSGTECARADASCQVGETAQFSSAITVNEDGNDADTRMESDTDTEIFFIDASTNRIGFSTTTPSVFHDVQGAASFADNNLTNIGSVALDSIGADATSVATTSDFFTGNGTSWIFGHTAQLTCCGGNTSENQVIGVAPADASISIFEFSADGNAPFFGFLKSRSTDFGSTNAIVADNDQVLRFRVAVDDGTDLNTEIAQFIAEVDDGSPAVNAVGGAFVFRTSTTAGTMTEAFRIDSSQDLISNDKDIYPVTDGAGSLGIQTTNQWGNVWSDLINGADYGYENGWRMLEADTYAGYGPGIAIDFGDHFETGKAFAVRRVDTGNTQQVEVGRTADGIPILENRSIFNRERVTDVARTPVFAVTADFIEFNGVRITTAQWAALAALVN